MQNKKVLTNKVFFALIAIFAFASIALLQTVSAANPVIFDGTVLQGDKYKASTGEEFSVAYVPAEDKVVIDFPGDAIIVKNKTCNTGKKLEGCVGGITFKGYNYTPTRREVYEFKIKLSQILLVPEIKIDKYIEKGEVEVGEETTVYVNITNSGPATGEIYFTEAVPPSLKIIELPDQHCEISKNNTLALAVTEMKENARKRCNYKVIPAGPGTYALVSAAEFDTVKRERVEASASLKVKDLPFSVTATYPPVLLLGEKFNITIVLKSDKKIDPLKFSAFMPGQIKVLSVKSGDVIEGSKHTTEKQDSGLKILNSNKLTSLNGNAEIIISSEAVAVGEVLISTNASWSFDSLKQQMAKDFLVNVTFAKPYFRLGRYDNKNGQASIDVVNPAHLPIFKVSLSFNSFAGLNNQPLAADEISSLSHAGFDIAQKPLGSSDSSAGSDYNGSIRYHTQYGQELVTEAALPINASQLPKAVMPVSETPPNAPEAGQPTAEEDETEKTVESAIQEPVKPKRTSSLGGIKAAAIIVGVVIAIMIIFLMLRAKKENKEEETELEKTEEEGEKPDFEKYQA